MTPVADLSRNNVTFFRYGKIVFARVTFVPSAPLSYPDIIGTIPEGFRPSLNTSIYTDKSVLFVESGGNIQAGGQIPNAWTYGFGVWVTP